jgi:transposase-like protein
MSYKPTSFHTYSIYQKAKGSNSMAGHISTSRKYQCWECRVTFTRRFAQQAGSTSVESVLQRLRDDLLNKQEVPVLRASCNAYETICSTIRKYQCWECPSTFTRRFTQQAGSASVESVVQRLRDDLLHTKPSSNPTSFTSLLFVQPICLSVSVIMPK